MHVNKFISLRVLLRALTLLVLFVFAGVQPAAAASTDLTGDMARLERGEILVQTIHGEKSGGAARVTALFHTTERHRVTRGMVAVDIDLASCGLVEVLRDRRGVRYPARTGWPLGHRSRYWAVGRLLRA